ncbi:MAG: hypothetical protein ACRDK9_12030 [Solirubrobacterales bacterium]
MGSHLATYLRDHHAGATGGVELARRAAGSNEGNAYGKELARIAAEIAEDRDALERVMEELGVRADPIKDRAAWVAEKLGRLKPNGSLVSYSPLSRVIELEGLVLGVTGKVALWESLKAATPPGVETVDLERLAERAADQRSRLEDLRRTAASEALGKG